MTSHRLGRVPLIAAAGVLLMEALPVTATADILVLDSSVPGIRRGAVLSDSARLKVPAGRSITIMRPAGETQEVAGPYDRLVGELSRGETIGDVFRSMKQQLDPHDGGSVGASRGVTR